VLVASGITTLGKTVLLVVAITFILWSLYTAMVVPKRRPGFPKRLEAFIVVSACLFAAQIGAVLWVSSTQEIESEEIAVEEAGGQTEPGDTLPAETESTDTVPAASGDPAAGKDVFASAGCATCHTLADAGATGQVGPGLDETQPSAELVVDRVTNGKGVMPPFGEQLSEQQIQDVAAYVSSVAGTS